MNPAYNIPRVQVGPANYYSGDGAFGLINNHFSAKELSRAFVIGGKRAYAAGRDYLPGSISGITPELITGPCMESLVDSLAERAGDKGLFHPVIGIGGGTVMDVAKATAARLRRPFVALPTIAATCAAWTPLSVWYDERGMMLRFESFPQAAFAVLVEPRVIFNSPVEYLRAGAGDTLVKWYEADIICAKEGDRIPLTARLGLDLSRKLRDMILSEGPQVFTSIKEGVVSPAFHRLVDAIIAGGGSVGGLGERFTRVAAAHSFHNGLTVVPGIERFLHGEKVAYGLLVQCALMHDHRELEYLRNEFSLIGLPITLSAFGVDIHGSMLGSIIERTLRPGESIHYLPGSVTPSDLRSAISLVEGERL